MFASIGTSSVDFNGGGPIFPRTPPLPTFTLSGQCSGDEEYLLECEIQQLTRDTEECPDMSFARIVCRGQYTRIV